MDADGNVFVDGHPHIVIAPQGGNTGIGGEATDAALSVEGDARFDGVKDQPGLFLVFWIMQVRSLVHAWCMQACLVA